jgi:hypothetical protein
MIKKIKSLLTARIVAIVLLMAAFLLGSMSGYKVLANDTPTPPSFPACESVIFTSNGDLAHYDYGIHGIVGVGNLEGSDDVYSQGNGNALQCYCPVEGTGGIQTDWWDAQRAGLNQEQIEYYKNQGYIEINGLNWNLYNETYLVVNRDFSCSEPSVTPTPTPAPSTTPGPESRCYQLEAQPMEGSAPLTVKFIAHADDPATNGKIKQYKFFFDDDSGGQPELWYQDTDTAYHRYENEGTYWASLNIQDYAGNWRGSENCRVEITVSNQPQVLSASTTTELPSTGVSALVIVALTALPGVGYFLYRRFRLV